MSRTVQPFNIKACEILDDAFCVKCCGVKLYFLTAYIEKIVLQILMYSERVELNENFKMITELENLTILSSAHELLHGFVYQRHPVP